MNDNEKMVSTEKAFPFIKLISKNIMLIIIVTILCGGLFFGYTMLNQQTTTYTASCSIIISAKTQGGTPEKDVLYTQLYLSTIKNIAEGANMAKTANDYYKDEENGYTQSGSISNGNFSFSYNNESLIVKVSYVDVDKDVALEKLDAYIKVLEIELKDNAVGSYINSNKISLIRLQEEFGVRPNNSSSKDALTGVLIGLVLSLAIVFVKYFIAGKIESAEELEEITGSKVLDAIE